MARQISEESHKKSHDYKTPKFLEEAWDSVDKKLKEQREILVTLRVSS